MANMLLNPISLRLMAARAALYVYLAAPIQLESVCLCSFSGIVLDAFVHSCAFFYTCPIS